ncbi:MAG: MlaD family protein [Candidatus Gygaella obscura]|nr:MlaD family protein [Candidatus Gygaella obscura]
MHDRLKEFIAGLFFIFGIVVFLIVFFVIGNDKGITSLKFNKKVIFSDVAGLSIGAPVRLSGVNVGIVESIHFTKEEIIKEKNIVVVLSILSRYGPQFKGCLDYSIRTEGVLGGKLIEIKPSKSYQNCQDSEFAVGDDPLDIQDLTVSFDNTAKSLTSLSQRIEDYLKQLSKISYTIKRTIDRLEKRIIEGTLFNIFK